MVIAVAIVTGRFRLQRVPRAAMALVGGLIALNLLSCMEVVDAPAGARFLLITLYLLVFALWLAEYVNSPRKARLVLRAYLLIAVLSALVSVVALYVPFPGHSIFLSYIDTRARGLFKDANVYAPFLIPVLLILFEELVNRRLLRLRSWLLWLCICVLALGVLVSFTRRLAQPRRSGDRDAGCRCSTPARRGSCPASQTVLLGSGAVILTVLALAEPRSMGFLEERARAQSYDVARFAAQGEGVALGMSHPVGIGPGQFGVYSALATHSTYVRVLAEQGFLGLALYVGLALMTLALALENVGAGRDTYGIGSGALLGSWCGLLVNSGVVDTIHWRHLWVVAALIWAGAMSALAARGRLTARGWNATRESTPLGMSGRPAVTSRRDVSGSTPSVRRWSDMSSTPSSPREQTASAGAGDASSRILANSGFRALADIGGKLGSAVLYIVLARKVGATDYGVYTFALSFTSLLVVAGGIGQDVVLTREVARDRRRLSEYLANSVASRLVLNLSLLLLAVTIATVAGMAGEARLVILLLGLGAIIDTLLKLVFAVFQAFERLGPVPVVLIAQRWVTTAAALVALYLGGEVVAVAAIYFAVALLAFALGIAQGESTAWSRARAGP